MNHFIELIVFSVKSFLTDCHFKLLQKYIKYNNLVKLLYPREKMKLPESLELIGEYLDEKRGGDNYTYELDCTVSGVEKNILILSPEDCDSFTDMGFSKNDAIDVKISNKSYSGIIKELYSKYCYVEIPAKDVKIKRNASVSLVNSLDSSFLYENMFKAYTKIFEKNKYEKLRDFFIKVYSDEKLESPMKLKTFEIAPPNRKNLYSFYNPTLDDAQKELVIASLNLTSDENTLFYLGFGPPGCGKTATITEIALQLLKLKKRLLITSFTNVAVDNVIERLLDIDSKNPGTHNIREKIVRVGSQRNIRIPKVAEVSLQKKLLDGESDKNELINNSQIVGATLDMLGTSVFENIENFDLMIVDEASMVETTKLLMGLSRCNKFVLIGDHLQLRPFLDLDRRHPNYEGYKDVIENPFFTVLMNRLSDSDNENFHTQLVYHYRSPKEIIRFSNDKFYNKKLVCKTSDKNIRKFDDVFNSYNEENDHDFIKKIFDPNNKVVLIDTTNIERLTGENLSQCEYFGETGSRSYCNVANAAIDLMILFQFLNVFYKNPNFRKEYRSRIGIISPFNYQVDLLEKFIFEHPEHDPYFRDYLLDNDPVSSLFRFIELFNLKDELEIGTVNKYQGREKDIIIYDFTYWLKDHSKKYHTALRDANKLNVALTRAKSKLVIVGSFYKTGIDVIDELHKKEYVTFNPAWYEQIDVLIKPMKEEYNEIYERLKEIQKKILSNAPSNYTENISGRIKKINSQEETILEIAKQIQGKYPNFDRELIRNKIREKVEMLTERYYNTYPQKMNTLLEKERFNRYLDFEIQDDVAIENETASKFGDLEKLEDLEILKNFENYLEDKKTKIDKDTYLYEGIERKIQLVKTKISILERRPKVSISLRNFSKYLKGSIRK